MCVTEGVRLFLQLDEADDVFGRGEALLRRDADRLVGRHTAEEGAVEGDHDGMVE